ncbi:MAG TPA: SRPBCC family protein [Nocardioidaceae bacterium]|nr:SRPBCC family protein [Nocardioidaceae bacterium]
MGTALNETTVNITAPLEKVWPILMDVESWPSLTESMTSVQRLDGGPLQVGSRVRIHQPKLPAATWTVTELVRGDRFVWTARGPGFASTAYHEATSAGDGQTRLRLAVEQSGPLGGLVGRLGRKLTDRYIALEAAGIKRRAEETA